MSQCYIVLQHVERASLFSQAQLSERDTRIEQLEAAAVLSHGEAHAAQLAAAKQHKASEGRTRELLCAGGLGVDDTQIRSRNM